MSYCVPCDGLQYAYDSHLGPMQSPGNKKYQVKTNFLQTVLVVEAKLS